MTDLNTIYFAVPYQFSVIPQTFLHLQQKKITELCEAKGVTQMLEHISHIQKDRNPENNIKVKAIRIPQQLLQKN